MEPSQYSERLSMIVTRWSLLRQAHDEGGDTARFAQERLLARYGGAVRRYLLGCTRNPDMADELYQEFAIKLLQGGMQGAKPEKGRFRHFLKGVLFHLLADQHQKQKRRPLGWKTELPEPMAPFTTTSESDAAFQVEWRAELLNTTWRKLQEEEASQGQPYFTVLAHRREFPKERSEETAISLTGKLGKTYSAPTVRQILHRARERFAYILLEQVTQSLNEPTVEELHQEVVDLDLLKYCKPTLDNIAQKWEQ